MLEDVGEGSGEVVGARPVSRAQVRALSVVSICSCFMAFTGSRGMGGSEVRAYMVFIIMPVGGGFSLCVYEESGFLYFTYRCVGAKLFVFGGFYSFCHGQVFGWGALVLQ